MKVVIVAGGFGSRSSEESVFKPKPMARLYGNNNKKIILWN